MKYFKFKVYMELKCTNLYHINASRYKKLQKLSE